MPVFSNMTSYQDPSLRVRRFWQKCTERYRRPIRRNPLGMPSKLFMRAERRIAERNEIICRIQQCRRSRRRLSASQGRWREEKHCRATGSSRLTIKANRYGTKEFYIRLKNNASSDIDRVDFRVRGYNAYGERIKSYSADSFNFYCDETIKPGGVTPKNYYYNYLCSQWSWQNRNSYWEISFYKRKDCGSTRVSVKLDIV